MSGMGWRITDDAAAFLAAAGADLRRDRARNTVLLTVAEQVRVNPAFYARSSGFKLEHRCDGLHDLARTIRLQREIGPGGLLIANPIPEPRDFVEKNGMKTFESISSGIPQPVSRTLMRAHCRPNGS